MLEAGDVGIGAAELTKDVGIVLAQAWAGATVPHRRALEAERRAEAAQRAEHRMW